MSNQRAYNRRKRSTEQITIPVVYLEICQWKYEMAAVLKQIDFWSGRCGDADGWFFRKYEQWADDLHIPERTFRRIIRALEASGFIETKLQKVNNVPMTHYRPIDEAIEYAMGINDDQATAVEMGCDSASMTDSIDTAKMAETEPAKVAEFIEPAKVAESSISKDDLKKTFFLEDKKKESVVSAPQDTTAGLFAKRPWRDNRGNLDEGFKAFIAKQMPSDGTMPQSVKALRNIQRSEREGNTEYLLAQWDEYQSTIKPSQWSEQIQQSKESEYIPEGNRSYWERVLSVPIYKNQVTA